MRSESIFLPINKHRDQPTYFEDFKGLCDPEKNTSNLRYIYSKIRVFGHDYFTNHD